MAKRANASRRRWIWVLKGERLFTLTVCIVSGPMTAAFLKRNSTVCRTIQIRGYHTLEDLHYTIFKAFGRKEQHMYEFQIGGKGPMDPEARRYVLSIEMENPDPGIPKAAGDAAYTAIGNLGLKVGDAFGYWFDFGDDWWHQIHVDAIDDKAPRGRFPRVTERVGDNPAQYPDWDEEGEEEDAG